MTKPWTAVAAAPVTADDGKPFWTTMFPVTVAFMSVGPTIVYSIPAERTGKTAAVIAGVALWLPGPLYHLVIEDTHIVGGAQ